MNHHYKLIKKFVTNGFSYFRIVYMKNLYTEHLKQVLKNLCRVQPQMHANNQPSKEQLLMLTFKKNMNKWTNSGVNALLSLYVTDFNLAQVNLALLLAMQIQTEKNHLKVCNSQKSEFGLKALRIWSQVFVMFQPNKQKKQIQLMT